MPFSETYHMEVRMPGTEVFKWLIKISSSKSQRTTELYLHTKGIKHITKLILYKSQLIPVSPP